MQLIHLAKQFFLPGKIDLIFPSDMLTSSRSEIIH